MRIDSTNYAQANKALASVLLLYYHLLREGGITNDQTVYLAPDDFDPFAYLAAEVSGDQKSEVDETLLREGAAICLLCDLNDLVADCDGDCSTHPLFQTIVQALTRNAAPAVPESLVIAQEISASKGKVDHERLKTRLNVVFEKYVVGRFRALARIRPASTDSCS